MFELYSERKQWSGSCDKEQTIATKENIGNTKHNCLVLGNNESMTKRLECLSLGGNATAIGRYPDSLLDQRLLRIDKMILRQVRIGNPSESQSQERY